MATKIVDAKTVRLARGGRFQSQFDVLLPAVQKLRSGKALQVTGAVEDARLKTLQNQLHVWIKRRRARGVLPGVPKLSVRKDEKGQLWLVAAEAK